MRFRLGTIPETPDFVPDGEWRALREPDPWMMQFFAIPIGITCAGILGACWFLATPLIVDASIPHPAVLLALGIAIVPVHELIHAVTHPMQGRSRHSVIGFWPATILFYAHYLGELRRNRFLAILLMPFVLLSVAPLALASLSQLATGSVAFVSIVNGLFACGDILGAVLILAQIPSDAVVRNQGWRSYWRREDTRPAAGAAGTAD